MAVHSKMTTSQKGRSAGGLLLSAGAALALVPGMSFTAAGSGQTALRSPVSASQAAPAAQAASDSWQVPAAAAAAAVSGATAGMTGAYARRGQAQRRVAAAASKRPQEGDAGLNELVNLGRCLLEASEREVGQAVARLQAFAAAELSRGGRGAAAEAAFAEVAKGMVGGEGRHRWAANAAASLLFTYAVTLQPANALDQVSYSDFLGQVKSGNIEMVRVQSDMLSAQYTAKDGSRKEVTLVPNQQVQESLFTTLAQNKVDLVMQSPGAQGMSPFDFLARFAGPIAWLIVGLLFLFGGIPFGGPGGPGGNPFELGKSKARIIKDGDTKVKFADVAGCDGAKQELVEVVDFLKNTSKYAELGAKIPKGALLVGPPGTGKTLLAKAVAGEAGVPFFSISASEFVEIFAGIGASRVRDLFEQAKKSAPCIIFIDEIDAVGRQRSAGFGQGNDEREQTVNQLLTEMDGFESNNGVVVIAATNRADILDAALVRPGRFDRQIQVDPPDVQGRTEILKVHAKGKSIAPSVDLSAVARQTPGMSGADLANLLNEGAIMAARQNKSEIDQDDIANALERIAMGLEKKDSVMSAKKRKLVAYHEAGHAVLGALMNDYDVVAKISIVPRGPAGGVTIFMPSEERLNSGLYSKEFLENRMCVALGGRLAEEIINGKNDVTTGASNDFQQCTQVANAMVTQLGMSEAVGQRIIGAQQGGGGPFMGRDFMGQGAPPVSQSLKRLVDSEVRRIVDVQYQRGMKLLKDNMFLLDGLAKKLLEQEKVSGEELAKMVNEAAIMGKLVVSEPVVAAAAAAFAGEAVCAKKDRCLHPTKPVLFACSDCPRRGGMTGGEEFAAVAAYAGEEVTSGAPLSKKDRCLHPSKPSAFACGDCPRRAGMSSEGEELLSAAALVSRRIRPSRGAVARLGLEAAMEQRSTGQEVMAQVAFLASEVSNGTALPADLLRTASAQVLAALIATSLPMAARADVMDQAAVPGQVGNGMVQAQPEMRVSGRVTYSRLLEFVEDGSVQRVDFYDMGRAAVVQVKIAGREQQLVCDLPGAGTGLIEKLQAKDVRIEVHTPEKPNEWGKILGDVAFPLLIIGGLLFLRSRGGGPGGMPFGGQGKAKIMITPQTGVKFADVAGIDEAKEELTEVVDFLKAPERFVKVGAKIPRGVLLTGPPGTGKTLMAKALAGESGVPFIQSSASEFIELFVGVGASRVRDIFKQAKEKAPCIVFIDEIDAIGRQRGAGMGGGNDEREQTLNQILTEMDGFEGNTGVIVVAATNRADVLDSALLRPGRFDRRVMVGLPDVKGRAQILKVHCRNKKLAEGIELTEIAKRTAGFSGADLENLMNESAILTARRNKTAITMDEVNDAADRVIAGLEGRALADNSSKKLTAYHEAGHALVGSLLPDSDPVGKVTIVPRGQAKGLTWFSPSEDQSLVSMSNLKARIATALGGRAAEQIVFGSSQVTTGAGGDLQQVERLARAMVTQFGMSDVGSIAIDDGGFMGPSYSEELSSKIDEAIRGISDECYLTALKLCMDNRACLDRLADELTETETLTGDRCREIIAEYTPIPEKMAAN